MSFTIVLCNNPPVFTQDMNNLALSENTPVGSVVYTLEGYDPESSAVRFGLLGTDNFAVEPITGAVTVIKALDREVSEKQRDDAKSALRLANTSYMSEQKLEIKCIS